MRDKLRRHRALRHAFTPWYPGEPTGHLARHVTTLAALISGIVARKSAQLPKVASQVPDGTKPESRVKRFTRWVGNDRISEEGYFLPSAEVLLEHWALQPLVLVLDGSAVGCGCVALMVHVVSTGRALPLGWLVRHRKKGHVPDDLHVALVEQVHEMIPLGASVVFLGDGACDGIGLQQTLEDAGWSYVCRTGCHLTATWDGMPFRLDLLGEGLTPGHLIDVPEAFFTAEAYGPVRLICCWAKGDKDPLYVVTNMASAEEACHVYAKRFRIEIVQTQMTKGGGFAFGPGGHDVANFHLAVVDDDTIDEQFD